MAATNYTLDTAFLEDHRHLTKGLAGLLESLRQSDAPRATTIARELDRVAGPHMAFEEAVLYPELAGRLGRAFVDQLYHEHALGQNAVLHLVRRDESAPLTAAERATLIEQVETALDHALSCGSLLSYLSTLSTKRHGEMLQQLLDMRAQECLWTDLPAQPGHAS
jgi:hypothetical protein